MNLTEAHRLAQLRLGAETAALIVATWKLLDPRDDLSVARWLAIVTPVVATQRAKSAALAAAYYTTERRVHTGASKFEAGTVDGIVAKQIKTSLLVTGPVAVRAAIGRGVTVEQAIETAQATSARAAMRHALNAGRDTVIANLDGDDRARGWQRVTSGKACEFCSMLAGRGAVYSKTTVDFHSHDGCACSAAPVFT